jgi:hypothetical protein
VVQRQLLPPPDHALQLGRNLLRNRRSRGHASCCADARADAGSRGRARPG